MKKERKAVDDITDIVEACLTRQLEKWEAEGEEEARGDQAVVGDREDNLYPVDVPLFVSQLMEDFETNEDDAMFLMEVIYQAAFAVGFNAEAQRRAEHLNKKIRSS